jgi:hypothetical protein
MSRTLRRQALACVFLCLAIFVIGVKTADATHFLGGKVTWRRDVTHPNPNEARIIISFQASWRADFGWTPFPSPVNQIIQAPEYDIILTTFQGTQAQYLLHQRVSSYNAPENWFTGTYDFAVVYPLNAFPITAVHTQCCRSSVLREGNNDQSWELRTVIDLTKGTRSPDSTMLPRIYLEEDVAANFQIPNTAFDGYTNAFALAPVTDSLLVSARPVGTSFCANGGCQQCAAEPVPNNATCNPALRVTQSGFVTWTPQVAGLYAVQFKITGFDANNVSKTSMPLDALIQVVAACPTCPKVLVSAPASVNGIVGLPLSFNVTTTLQSFPPGRQPALNSTPLPGTATLSPVTNFQSPLVSTFNWTPAAPGDSFVCFQGNELISGQTSFGQACTTIHVADNVAPQLQCDAAPPVDALNPLGALVTLNAASFDPELQGVTVQWKLGAATFATSPIAAGTNLLTAVSTARNFPIGSSLVTVVATDGVRSSTCNIDVTVNKIAQSIDFPSPAAPIAFGSAPLQLTPVASSGLPVTLQVVSGPGSLNGTLLSLNGVGSIEVKATQTGDATYLAADPVIIMVHVEDHTAPTIAAHGPESGEAENGNGVMVTYASPAYTDDVSPAGTAQCVPASGSVFPVGSTTVTCTATDAAGNSATSTFAVNVGDTTAPSIGANSNVTVPANSAGGAVVPFAPPPASDSVDGAITPVCVPGSGSTFPIGTTQVTCTATDAHGNSAASTFTVTVTNNAPSITVPGNIVAEATSPAGAAVGFTATGSDIEDGPKTPSCSPAAGSAFGFGTTPVICTVTDINGVSTSAGFTVTVQDTTAPVVTYSGNTGTYALTQTISITCTPTDAVGVVSSTCAPISGPAYSFPAGANTFSATAADAAGNTGTGSTTFTVVSTLQSLQQLVNAFCDNPGVCSGLNAKLSAAAGANNANARAGQLGAFANQVNAQAGKCLTPAEAAILLQLVQAFY